MWLKEVRWRKRTSRRGKSPALPTVSVILKDPAYPKKSASVSSTARLPKTLIIVPK